MTTPIILFLNKSDLFREKIANSQYSLANTFPDAKGGETFDEGVELIRNKFLGMANDTKKIYPHVTCATDTEQIDFIFSSVRDTLFKELLKDFDIPY